LQDYNGKPALASFSHLLFYCVAELYVYRNPELKEDDFIVL